MSYKSNAEKQDKKFLWSESFISGGTVLYHEAWMLYRETDENIYFYHPKMKSCSSPRIAKKYSALAKCPKVEGFKRTLWTQAGCLWFRGRCFRPKRRKTCKIMK